MKSPLKIFLILVVAIIPVFSTLSQAGLKPFEVGSIRQILAARQGQTFLLVLWSVDCPSCLRELEQLKQLREKFRPKGLVLISTDELKYQSAAEAILDATDLDGFDNWIFGDRYRASLRYQIDPNWHGELPRAYYYSADHQRTGHSGLLNREHLENWLKQQTKSGGNT